MQNMRFQIKVIIWIVQKYLVKKVYYRLYIELWILHGTKCKTKTSEAHFSIYYPFERQKAKLNPFRAVPLRILSSQLMI